ncbi:MAG TPA: PhoX family phosphatase [Burkholderiales bacterium]|jgi:secreted PhoX family phosphatase
MSQHDDDPVSNPSVNKHFSEVVEISMQRRRMLQGGLGAAVLSFFGLPALTRIEQAIAQGIPPAPSFLPISAAFADEVRLPPGYSAQVLYRWGDPTGIEGNMPEFDSDAGVSWNSAADQSVQAGMDHDGMHYFPHDSDHDDDHGHRRGKRRGKRNSGLLCINHENIEPEFLLQPVLTDADKVAKMKNAHGVSVIEVRQDDGEWEVVRPSKYARRITGDTPMRISGPAAGHAMMKTSADPQGRRVLGTLNNCADGSTPWGTYLTCEENFNGYFASTDPAAITPHMRRYGVAASPFGYNWHQVDTRFDVAVEPNESNRFGWVVEIDPKRPDRKPIKHTALGRMKHENAAVVLADDRRVVVYMGDDERNEYIYKFVSHGRLGRRGDDGEGLLETGTLYVAIFEPGRETGDGRGTGRWVPLVFGKNGLTPENGFASQAEVLIKTRQAADRVGATMMDRPEWIAVHPTSKEVYITLTNNNRRGTTPASANSPDGTTAGGSARPAVDEANPRANNVYGHILRWRESRGDPAALTFEWDVYLLAGDPADPGTVGAAAVTNTVGFPNFGDATYRIFSAPDGLGFDKRGWLWIQTDYGASQSGVQANMGNCHMMVADIPTGHIGRFLTGPNGCEITGWTMTPDQRSLFINIQHPGEATASTWPDRVAPPRSATIVITRNDGGVIGT